MATVSKIERGGDALQARAAPADAAEPVPVSGKAGIAIAMAAAFANIDAAIKTTPGQVGQQKYKYADLGAVIDAIKPALIEHGLFFVQRPVASDGGVTVNTVLHHTSGEWMDLGALFVPANKNDAQAYGSALTYARRYALVTAFGVPVEDDDGSAATRSPPAAPRNDAMPDDEYNRLVHLVEATNSNVAALLGHLKINVRDNNLRLLNQDQFGRVLEALNHKLATLAKAETNAKAGA